MTTPTVVARPAGIFWLLACAAWGVGIVLAALGLLGSPSTWNRLDVLLGCAICLFIGLILGSLS
jgi:hypothetical protein